MNPRIISVIKRLKINNLDALLLSYGPNISYLTGLKSRDSFFLISRCGCVYITDFRYLEETQRHLKRCRIKIIKHSLFQSVAEACRELGVNKIGFEARHLSFWEHQRLKAELKKVKLFPISGIVEELRELKSGDEVAKIRKATQIAIASLRFSRRLLKPGRTELEVAGELERFIRYKGADASSFQIIVASGPNSSYPHHVTSRRKIRLHESVLIDIGVDSDGYKSDLTRVFFLGKINLLARKVYAVVREAQVQAIKAVKPKASCSQIDQMAREYICRHGFGGKYFGHSLGHGIGLEVHEAPRISAREEKALKAGMVFTVEPGVYLPGKFGIRLEDMVLVTPKGVEVLSGALNQ